MSAYCPTWLRFMTMPQLTGAVTTPDPQGDPEWTLDTLTAVAQQQGIQVARSQIRRIFRQEGISWRRTRWWATSKNPNFAPCPQKGADRHPLHRPAGGSHCLLRR